MHTKNTREWKRTRIGSSATVGAAFLILFSALSSADLHAQSLEDQFETMRARIQQFQEELDSVKAELRRTRQAIGLEERETPFASPAVAPTQAGLGALIDEQGGLTPEEALPLMQAQLQELAQTKVQTNSRFPMRVFGAIVSNTFRNTGEPNWMDLGGNVVKPGPPAGLPAGSFNSTMRQSRLGVILDGPQVGSFRTSALAALDFFGGLPNFQTAPAFGLPRMLYAYMRFENDRTAFQIGQDHMVLAPKNPTSLTGMAFPTLFRAGNLYLRVPQIRAERTVIEGSSVQLQMTAGILAPIAGDTVGGNGYQFVAPVGAGERSRTPGVQSRLAVRATPDGPYETPDWELGVSGHYSRERYTTGIVLVGRQPRTSMGRSGGLVSAVSSSRVATSMRSEPRWRRLPSPGEGSSRGA
jgi:hypothetical protein